ncbi:MAG: TIGR02597 family protein [Akkermansiaceae bacterium]|nr:TIGR02597 family protein [Akkermansiaceae bacterium]
MQGGAWRRVSATVGTNFGTTKLFPDNYFTIRHPNTVTTSTVFKSYGEVEIKNFTIPLSTLTNGSQDTFVAILRPVPVTLSQLNLWQSGAFVASTGISGIQRRDQLLVFNNEVAALNKAASAIYFHNGTSWLKAGDGTVNHDSDVIPPSSGFLIRKFRSSGGNSVDWKILHHINFFN